MKPTWFVVCAAFVGGVGVGVLGVRAFPCADPGPEIGATAPRAEIAGVQPLLEGLPAAPGRTSAPRPAEAAVKGTTSPAAESGDPRRMALLQRIHAAGGRVGVRRAPREGRPAGPGIEWLEADALGGARPVVELQMPSTAMDALGELAELPDLSVLRFSGSEKEIDLSQLPTLPSLERIVFDTARARARGLTPLSRQPRLARVDFSDTSLDGEALGVVAALESVRRLTLDSGRVTDETLAALAGATRLERLNLDDALVTDAGLAHLAGMTNLKELVLTGTRITGEGFRHLSRLAALETVVLDKTRVNDEGLRHLAALPGLKSVDLEATDITDAGLAHLLRSRTLTDLILEGTRISDGAFTPLGRLGTLRTLSVLNTQVTADGLERFRSAHPEVRIEE